MFGALIFNNDTFAIIAIISAAVALISSFVLIYHLTKGNEREEAAAQDTSPALFAGNNNAVSDEVVAAISAALSLQLSQPFRIKSITREGTSSGKISAWGLAGRLQNTAPF